MSKGLVPNSKSIVYKVLTVLAAFAGATIPLHCWATPGASNPPVEVKTEVMVDAVVASVDDKPITLSELNERFVPPRKLSLEEASHDPEAAKLLETLILEKLLEEEAAAKRMSVSDADVEDYINEVARRNNLPRAEFEHELVSEGGSLPAYKRQVRLDILKTKLTSNLSRGGVSVSEKEIDEYISEHPELSHAGVSFKLRQILFATAEHPLEELEMRLRSAQKELSDGSDFNEVAKRYSDGPQAQDGGLIGIVAENDLTREVADALHSLEAGQVSKPIEAGAGIQIFKVEQRFSKDDDDDESPQAFRDEIRKSIAQQKTQDKLSSYFVTELYKNHVVDKKL